jgi:predicted ThiF/HesA family dinucleotide-utilizing enzyme
VRVRRLDDSYLLDLLQAHREGAFDILCVDTERP